MPFTFSPNALLEEEGVPLPEWGRASVTHYRVIGGSYFQSLGVPLRGGRFFTESDRAAVPLVAIVNEATVRQMWSGGNALGRRVRMRNIDGIEEFATIVGVVRDMRHRALTTPPVSEVFSHRPTAHAHVRDDARRENHDCARRRRRTASSRRASDRSRGPVGIHATGAAH
jgi:hypothetical protein